MVVAVLAVLAVMVISSGIMESYDISTILRNNIATINISWFRRRNPGVQGHKTQLVYLCPNESNIGSY